MQGWSYVSKKFDSQEKVDSLLRNTNGQVGVRSLCIDPGIASTATVTLIHSSYEKDNINLNIPRGPRDDIDRRYRKQQSCIKIDAGITEIEGRLVQRKPVEAKLVVGDSDVSMEGDSGITSNSQDTITPSTKAVEKAIQDYESAVKVHLVNVANEASTLRSFYDGARFKQDKYDYREALRHDLDKATTAILRMRKHVPDQQPSDEDLEKVLYQLDEDIDCSMAVVNGLPNVKEYNWASYLRLMDEVNKLSGIERETLLKSKSLTRRRKKIARSLYKRGFLNLNTLPDDKCNAFLQSPLVIGLGDGDFRGWRGQSRGGSKFTKNLIRQTRNLVKDLARSKKKMPVVIELVKISEFRTSIFCCSCHFRMRVRGRSVICDECSWERDRDHNAATNMSNAVLQFLHDGQWPAPLDYERAKLVDKTTSTTIMTL
ncbi:hypothetical protein BGX27_007771 [Mortierella sp. AM989]|nr:hypothetical protein BGX27_007771 [Mortierella sp. AM989]